MSRTPTIVTAAVLGLGVLAAAAPNGAAAQDGYRIQPGDVLRIEVIEDPNLNREVLVPPDGRITVPLAGAVTAQNRTVEQVQAELAGQLAPNFAAPPNVFVSISQIAPERPAAPRSQTPAAPATIDVYIVGEAGRPGRLELAPGTTLLQAIAEMGGFSRFAATHRVQLRRTDRLSGEESIYPIDYDAVEEGRSTAGAITLADGDVIVVPQRGLFE
jgi:polysaccharide export outer membrane protein